MIRPLVLVTLLCGGCVMSAAGHHRQLERAVSINTAVDRANYRQIALDNFVCTMADSHCDPAWSQQAVDQAGLTLGRVGYEIYDTTAFHALFVAPPAQHHSTTVVHGQGVGISASVSAGPAGMAVSVHESAVPTVEVITYESVPQPQRVQIIQRAGIQGVVTGRITVGTPDEVTKWRRVHVSVRLVDAMSGVAVWQGEWAETMVTDVDSGVADCLGHLGEALEHRVSLFGPVAS